MWEIGGTVADIDNGDVLRIAASMVFEGTDEVTNVYHALVQSGGNKAFADVIDDIQEYMDLLVDNIDVFLSLSQVADRISISNVTQNLVFGSINWGVFAQGGAGGDVVPTGCCCLAFGRTLKPRVQIRKYYGIFTEVNLTGGLWVAALRAAILTDFEAHLGTFVGTDGLTLKGVAWNRTLSTYTTSTGAIVVAEPAYQRRRKRGRGS